MMIAVHQSGGVVLSAASREYAADRLTAALLRAEGHIRGVRVFVADCNGPKGGADKMCTVTVALAWGRPVTVVQRATTVTAAVDGAAHRAGQTVQRTVEKRAGTRRRLRALVRLVRGLFGKREGK